MIKQFPEIESAIMTFDEYQNVEHPTPYVYDLKKGNKKLVYFGMGHSMDPQDKRFNQLKERFDNFRPNLVFVEGMVDFPQRKESTLRSVGSSSYSELIKEMGETGFALKLAVENRVEVDSPEPSEKDLINNYIQLGFTKDEIFAHQIYIMVDQYYRMLEDFRPSLDDYLEEYRKEFQEITEWENFDYSLDNLKKIGKKIWGIEKSNIYNPSYAKVRVDPVPSDFDYNLTVINNMAKDIFRDRYIVREICLAMQKIDRLFIVYGASHAVMQEQALKKLFVGNLI